MSLIWHIVKKDLRALRWFMAAYGVLLFSRSAVRGPDTANVLLEFAHVVFVAAGIAWLIREDPLQGARARWVTMPIAPHRLRAAKVTAVALLFWLLPSVVHSSVRAWHGQVGSFLLNLAMALFLPAAALLVAMVTQGLLRFFIGFLIVLILPLTLEVRIFPFPGASMLALGPKGMLDVWIEILRRAVFLGGLVCVVAVVARYQFRARQGGRAELVAGLGLAALCVLLTGYAAVVD